MSEAEYMQRGDTLDYNPIAAVTAGNVIQLPDGRAAVPANDLEVGRLGAADVHGIFRLAKTADINLLSGGRVFWDVSAGKAHFRPESGTPDFYVGLVVADSPASQTYVDVALNARQNNSIDLMSAEGPWTTEAALGLGVTMLPGGVAQLAFDAVAEVAQAALYPARTVPIAARPIMEAIVGIFDVGNNAALDIDIGLASGSHASDFETVANFAAIHLDGNALDILVHSDDGVTDVAPVDSTVNAVDDTYFELWIDCREPEDVKIYINGVLLAPEATTLTLEEASTGLRPVVMIEKTSDDTVCDVRVSRLVVRTSGE